MIETLVNPTKGTIYIIYNKSMHEKPLVTQKGQTASLEL